MDHSYLTVEEADRLVARMGRRRPFRPGMYGESYRARRERLKWLTRADAFIAALMDVDATPSGATDAAPEVITHHEMYLVGSAEPVVLNTRDNRGWPRTTGDT
jgi:hypothetical protein